MLFWNIYVEFKSCPYVRTCLYLWVSIVGTICILYGIQLHCAFIIPTHIFVNIAPILNEHGYCGKYAHNVTTHCSKLHADSGFFGDMPQPLSWTTHFNGNCSALTFNKLGFQLRYQFCCLGCRNTIQELYGPSSSITQNIIFLSINLIR